MKILLVQRDSGAPLRQLVLSRGHQVVACADPGEARALWRAQPAPIVVIDTGEVGPEEIAFCRALREEGPAWRPYVFVALDPKQVAVADAVAKAAPDEVLIKPYRAAFTLLQLALAEERVKQWVEEKRATEMLSLRAQQQVAIAALGQSALTGVDLDSMSELVTTFIAQILNVEFCYFLEVLPDGQSVCLRAGSGWRSGCLGRIWAGPRVEPVPNVAQAGDEPLLLTDLTVDNRFPVRELLDQHGIRSGVNVAVKSKRDTVGMLGAFTAEKRSFAEDDLHFIEGLANVLGSAIERQRSDAEIQKLAAFPLRNPSPILELDAQGRVLYENPACQQLRQALGKRTPVDMLPSGYVEMLRECLVSGAKREEERVQAGNRLLSWQFYPLLENGVVHAYATDTTESESLHNQVQHLQRLESIGQLAAGLAHDYNNVLTIIHGHVTLVLGDSALEPTAAKSLKTALDAVERAARLTRQLLVFSRKESMQPEALDVNSTIESVTKLLDRLLGEKIQLRFQPGAALPSVQADPGLLEQVIINLAVNARDAMPQGGHLKMSTKAIQVEPSQAKQNPEARVGSFVAIEVADTGCGMDAATLDRIFEPFFTTKEAGKGTGLGLATVYGIIKQHQGWVSVQSQPGKGTTFTLFLPAIAQASPLKSAAAKSTAPRGHRERILVVEDEATVRALARLLLEHLGYEVVEAGSAAEALELWPRERDRVDLLLTDLVIPDGQTGFELAARLRQEKPALRVLITSGYDAEKVSRGILTTSGARFLQKPYRTETLARSLRECLESETVSPPVTERSSG